MKYLLPLLVFVFALPALGRPLIIARKTLGYKNADGQLSIGFINKGEEVRQIHQDRRGLYMSTKTWIENPEIPRDKRIRVVWWDTVVWVDGKDLFDPVPTASAKKLKKWFWVYKSTEFDIAPPGSSTRNDILINRGMNVIGAGTNYILKYLKPKVGSDYVKKIMRNCFDGMVEYWSMRGETLPERERLKFCAEVKR